jgi:hypothetical protein
MRAIVRLVRLTAASQVHRNDAESRGQAGINEPVERPRIGGQTGGENQRRAVPRVVDEMVADAIRIQIAVLTNHDSLSR